MRPHAQPIVIARAFEFFDVAGKLLLQELDAIADIPPEFIGKSAVLPLR